MLKRLRISVAIAIGILLSQSTLAQTKAPAKNGSSKDKPAARLEAERLRKERHEDYERAVQLARGFQAEAPRANATIAIARSVLNENRARVPRDNNLKNYSTTTRWRSTRSLIST